ncbi:MAG: bifunctional phosphoribosylaminoimidazolecarboxamide formyltransferase/IMP cyclohydrolase [Actinomycetota bacterium]|nr:bifunctional phosphoribosylaminoimidazolecarboxamide formyltransferase/IMP cyclohydrolase [Actinomycetota bacterium]
MTIERALISVFDKTGLDTFVPGLVELGVEIVASGGTAAYIEELGLEVTHVDELTEVPELLGGRVKTLHPRIHAAILARRDFKDDVAALEENSIRPFDLVCVNLYPFQQVAARKDVREEDAVEMIDIGGPAMLRAAAKNFLHVVPVCSPARYDSVLEEIRERGEIPLVTRRELAAEAFAHTAAYEASIAAWFADRETFPARLLLSLEKVSDLPYGENPHQRAAYYAEAGARRHLLSRVERLAGPEPSFNNLNDLDAARAVLREFTVPACVIVKHANPCGCALASGIEQAYTKALAADPISAYGGIVALNRRVERPLSERLAEQFIEVMIAPTYSDDALEVLREKRGLRVLEDRERRGGTSVERDYRRVLGGVLVQDADAEIDDREGMTVVTKSQPDEATWGDLLFAWRVAKHVASNAIVLAKDLQTLGIGAGQMSRVDAVRLAVEKAGELGHDLTGAALASDAFFPFSDGPELAIEAGVRALIQPGGSKRDSEVVQAVDSAGAAMVFTSRRHFRH